MPNSYQFVVAKSAEDREQAFRLRYDVFVREIGAFKPSLRQVEVDHFDTDATHILAKCDEQVVGLCRVIRGNATRTNGSHASFGLPGEAHYDYSEPHRDGVCLAEVSRSAVLPEHRGSTVLPNLWKCAYNCAKRQGATHVLGVVQVGYTDSLVDANLVHKVLGQRGLLHPRYDLQPRAAQIGPTSPVAPLYSDAERASGEPRMPPVMRLYHRFGLRACGKPVFISEIGRVGMAMLAGPDTFSTATLTFFESADPCIRLD